MEVWSELHPRQVGADAIDAQLHAERVDPNTRAQLHHDAAVEELPDGSFVLHAGAPHLVLRSQLLRWTIAGYTRRTPRPTRGRVMLITPPSLVAVLRSGWKERLVPLFHASARASTSTSKS